MKLFDFALVKITLLLISGILLEYVFSFETPFVFILTLSIAVLFIIAYINARKQFFQKGTFGFFTFLLVITIGISTANLNRHKNQKSHYSHFLIENAQNKIRFSVKSIMKSTDFNERYLVSIYSLENQKVKGKILLNIAKDSSYQPLKVDEHFLSIVKFTEFKKPLNPHQFDYKAYQEKRNIYHQISTSHTELQQLASSNTLSAWASKTRAHIYNAFKKNGFQQDELDIINALLLGQKQHISEEIYSHYANAGAVHILAISGLHIGIILLFLNILLKPMSHIKHAALIKTAIIVIVLWSFAFISGFSASVIRAVTMFSFIAYAMHKNKRINIFLVLIGSAFILLLIKPSFIFDVGFQLSYVAVFAIIWIHPLLTSLYKPKNRILRYFSQLIAVSLAAQLGVFPLVLFYFNQFPGLFLISNIVIVPFLGLILGLGFTIIILNYFQITPLTLITIFRFIIKSMNQLVSWIASKKAFLWDEIPFDRFHLIMYYILIILLVSLFEKYSYKKILFILLSIFTIQLNALYNKSELRNTDQLIIFHKNRNTYIANQKKETLIYYTTETTQKTKPGLLKDYARGAAISKQKNERFKNFYTTGNSNLLVVDSSGIYKIPELEVDYILLIDSPKVNLNRLIKFLHPKKIIADGSNYKSFIKRWKLSCKKAKLPFHYTGDQGAYIIE